jgi:hypothetical protein
MMQVMVKNTKDNFAVLHQIAVKVCSARKTRDLARDN